VYTPLYELILVTQGKYRQNHFFLKIFTTRKNVFNYGIIGGSLLRVTEKIRKMMKPFTGLVKFTENEFLQGIFYKFWKGHSIGSNGLSSVCLSFKT
jgi:hypothetical protein